MVTPCGGLQHVLEYISQLYFLDRHFLLQLVFMMSLVAMVATHCPSLLSEMDRFADRHGEVATNMHYSKCID